MHRLVGSVSAARLATRHRTAPPTLIARCTGPAKAHLAGRTRPISPHVTIYDFPLPALTSITTRATGAALFLGLSAGGVVGLMSPDALLSSIDAIRTTPVIGTASKALVAFPFTYHYLSGLRHLYWDKTAEGLSLDEVYKSSQILIGATAALTLLFTFL